MGLLTAAKFGLTDTEMLDLLAFMDVFHSTETYGKFSSNPIRQSVYNHGFGVRLYDS